MVLFRTVKLGDEEVKLAMSAYLAVAYRARTGRDLIVDMNKMTQAIHEAVKSLPEDAEPSEREMAGLSAVDIAVFASVAHIMAEEAGMEVPYSVREWLRGFKNPAMIYALITPIMEMWRECNKGTSVPAKK